MAKVSIKSHLNNYPKLSIADYKAHLSSHNSLPALAVSYHYQGKIYQQQITITRTACNYGGHRYWWLCPECGRRVGVLYHAGELKCRHCVGLGYQSQLQQPIDLLFNRIQTIRERLEWQTGIAHGHGNRPKGMHQTTYNHLTNQHHQIQQQILGKLYMFAKSTAPAKLKKPITEITLEDIIHELDFARTIASYRGNANAMIAVSMAKAKLLGLDKGQIDEPLETIFTPTEITDDNFDETLDHALKNCINMMEKVRPNKPKAKHKK